MQFKLLSQGANAGVQIRSRRIPDHHKMIGYQADLGDGWWGCLYDESRRRKALAGPLPEQRSKAVKAGQWNDYHIPRGIRARTTASVSASKRFHLPASSLAWGSLSSSKASDGGWAW